MGAQGLARKECRKQLRCTRFIPETDPKPFGKDSGIARNETYIDVVVATRIVSARCFKTGNRQTHEVQ